MKNKERRMEEEREEKVGERKLQEMEKRVKEE